MAPPTRCRAVRNRQAAPASQAAIWVTDVMLRQTIEKYQRRFLVTNRTLSSHRGPLECRRRPLGAKRNMTDIMASPPPYQPTWWFELMGNKNAWQWQSPTTPEYRKEMESRTTLSKAVDRCIKWLEASDLDKPYLQTPDATEGQQDLSAQATTRGTIAADDAASGLIGEVHRLRSDISQLETISQLKSSSSHPPTSIMAAMRDEGLGMLLQDCCEALQERIRRRAFTVEQVFMLLEPFHPATLDPRLSLRQAQLISRYVSEAIVSAIAAERQGSSSRLFQESWAAVVDCAFSLETGPAKFRLFSLMLREATSADLLNVDSTLCARVAEDFISHHSQALTSGAKSTWLIRLGRFAQALDSLPQGTLKTIQDSLHATVLNDGLSRERRFTSLLTAALLRDTSQSTVTELAQGLTQNGFSFSSAELWELIMARLVSDQTLDMSAWNALSKTFFSKRGSSWTQLAATLIHTNNHDSLHKLLEWTQIGGFENIVPHSLVWAQVDPESAALAADARHVMETMLKDPELSHYHFTFQIKRMKHRLLASNANTNQSVKSLDQNLHIQAGSLELLKFMAYWYLLSEKLSDRQAKRGIQWCMQSYERLNKGQGSAEILGLMARLVIRDLQAGLYGRTERLEWLVNKTAQYKGNEEARRALKALRGWRRMNDRSTR